VSAEHSFGTSVRSGFDVHALGKALRGHVKDLRHWCSEGTVGVLNADSGEWNFTDNNAIWNDSGGVHVDVQLQPLDVPVTCRYAGVQAGDVTIFAPIRPGDIVLVHLPEGDTAHPVISSILHSRSKRQPTENRKPIFDNNRLLIYAKTVPIDIRTAGKDGDPVQLLIEQDGTVTTTASRINQGASGLTEQEVIGTSYRQAEDTLVANLQSGVQAMQAAAIGPLAGFQPGLAVMNAALQAFKAAAQAKNGFLSNTVYVKQ
jgi:hypothetical protein